MSVRRKKGNSLVLVPDDFCVIDLETTGLHPQWDSILEMSAIKYHCGHEVDRFDELVDPQYHIDPFVTKLTGIDDDLVSDADTVDVVLGRFLNFIGDLVVVGHNVNFDLNFLYDNDMQYFNQQFSNDFVDTMRLSRKLLPAMKHHRLSDISEVLHIRNKKAHRAWSDCEATVSCLYKLYKLGIAQYGSLDRLNAAFEPKLKHYHHVKLDLKTLQVTDESLKDPDSFLFGKHCCFTGALKMTRKDAAQLVLNIGGFVDNNVTKRTNLLILGNNDYCSSIKGGKSSKQRKAEDYILRGQDLQIIPESLFYELVDLEN